MVSDVNRHETERLSTSLYLIELINKLYATLQRADYTLGRYLPQNVLALSLEASSDTI